VDTLWSLSYITDGDDDRIMATVETGIVRRIVELMYHSDVSVVVPGK
jgi:importin subunit alpha-1